MTFSPTESEYQPTVWCFRRVEEPVPEDVVPSKWNMQKAGTGAVLKSIVKESALKIECENDRVIMTGYVVENGIALHIINLADTVAEKAGKTDHKEIIPNFTPDGVKVPEAKLTVAIPAGLDVSSATLKTPEDNQQIKLDIKVENGVAEIKVPGGIFSGYALITVE